MHRLRDQLAEREEEIIELKAERNNTRVSCRYFLPPIVVVVDPISRVSGNAKMN